MNDPLFDHVAVLARRSQAPRPGLSGPPLDGCTCLPPRRREQEVRPHPAASVLSGGRWRVECREDPQDVQRTGVAAEPGQPCPQLPRHQCRPM